MRAVGTGSPTTAWDVRPAAEVLTVVLCLSLWLSAGSLVLAIANGLGDAPVRRLAVGAALVASGALAVWRRADVGSALRARPWLVVPVAGAALAGPAVDGLLGSPYVSFPMTAVCLAAVVARRRTVWLCVALLVVAHAGILVLDRPADLAQDGALGGVVGALLGYPVVALVALGLIRRFARFADRLPETLDDLRLGAPALTPALTRAVVEGRRAAPALEPARVPLTPMELRVVHGLAEGSSPKQLAHRWGLSLATVRTHIRNAKRKTGARTLTELAGMSVGASDPS